MKHRQARKSCRNMSTTVRWKRWVLPGLIVSWWLSLGALLPAAEPLRMPARDADGRPLNLDFETGTLQDWQAEGPAFDRQPIRGDTVFARRTDMKSQHQGEYWIGSYEVAGDSPQGTLTSVPFLVSHPWASFLIGGGMHAETRVELVREDTQQVIARVSGLNVENMERVAVDLSAHVGKSMRIRLVDAHSGGWGHINFDDFVFHPERPPGIPTREFSMPDRFAHHGLSPEEAARAMTVPEGFSVTLFAGEPDVQQPIAMALDDRGRLWVAEAYSYPVRVPDDKARDRILIFEDLDNDGRFDTRKVFYEGLNLISGLEVGFGGVWVGQAPYLLFIPDADRDDIPDAPPQVLLDGWGYQDTHETLNAFIWGPDGWLYGCHGVFTHSRVGKPGTPDAQRIPLNAGVWRYHPQRHAFEVFAHGTSNPWGVDFNERGDCFITACVIPHLYHVIPGARYLRQAGTHFNPYTYEDIGTIARHRHWIGATPHAGNGRSDAAGGGHAHAGAMIYQGGWWPARYHDQIFMNNIHGARLNQDLLVPHGSGYYGDRAPDFLLANDSWSQILYFTYGPDGDVLAIDWYDRNQCHHGNVEGHDRRNGRIFKIRYRAETRERPWPQPATRDLSRGSDDELVALITHPNEWYSRHARRLLQERGLSPQLCEQVEKVAWESASERDRLRGLWTLHVTGTLTQSRVLRALADSSAAMRAWGVRLASEQGTPSAEIVERCCQLAENDPSPVVRLALASAAQRWQGEPRVELLRRLIAHAEDADDHNLPLMLWYACEPVAAADPAAGLQLRLAARLDKVRRFLTRRLTQLQDPAVLEQLLTHLHHAPADQVTGDLQEIAWGLQGRRRVPQPAGWRAFWEHWWPQASPALQQQLDSLSLTFGDPQAQERRRHVLRDPQRATAERRQALEDLLRVQAEQMVPDLLALLHDAELAERAIRGLAQYDDPTIPRELLSRYHALPAKLRSSVLNTLASRASWARELLQAVTLRQIPLGDFTADLVRQLRSLKDESLESTISQLWGVVRETPQDKQRLIEAYRRLVQRTDLPTPDPSQGRAVFARVCQQCHVLFGEGRKVGPELTGSNRAQLDYILTNILDPSALIGRDYQVQVIVTHDGRTLNGIVKHEDPDKLLLATAQEDIVIGKADIEERVVSDKSMMPDDLVKTMSDQEFRALVAYLASPQQVPLPLTRDHAITFFNGRDLTGWVGNREIWSVEAGEIVGRSQQPVPRNEFLYSQLRVDDFRLEFEVKLVNNARNSGVQFRSLPREDGEMEGYQADIGAGWWGKLYEESLRGLLWDKPADHLVKVGDWNQYVIEAIGCRVRTWLNGTLCVDLEDPAGRRQGVIALQVHAGGPTEVRFRNFKLTPIRWQPRPAAAGQFLQSSPAWPADQVRFEKHTLDRAFRTEGAAYGDFNNDGLLDIAAGSVWYAAPDWQPHPIREQPREFPITTYGDSFFNWAEDVDADGRLDLIVVDFPGKPTWWFRNPGQQGGPWTRHEIVPVTNNESPQYLDLLGDGRRRLVFGDQQGSMSFAWLTGPAAWQVAPFTPPKSPGTERFSHGLGLGDLNGDGRIDVLIPQGWWQAPTDPQQNVWTFHPVPFGEAQAQMYVFDFDGDGDADVVGSSAHQRGIWWYEQTARRWLKHLIDDSIAQTHSLVLADINGDGLPDLVTGKRFYAHNGRDPGEDEPPVLCWFELQRQAGQPVWSKHVIDEDSGVGVMHEVYDLDGDDRLDIVVGNKRGVFVFFQRPATPVRTAQP
ncbi:MAG: hypothetical protein KatS3mg114_1440 [Planctomycetaceae bacterium]|nr:MAG: hypothetical protein KatS3mg114_1440 [Planctomycetaceae bacterium]